MKAIDCDKNKHYIHSVFPELRSSCPITQEHYGQKVLPTPTVERNASISAKNKQTSKQTNKHETFAEPVSLLSSPNVCSRERRASWQKKKRCVSTISGEAERTLSLRVYLTSYRASGKKGRPVNMHGVGLSRTPLMVKPPTS